MIASVLISVVVDMVYDKPVKKVLKKFLKEKFNLEFNLQREVKKSGSVLYKLMAKADNIPMFLEGISKFIVPSFEYKLDYKHEKVSPNGISSNKEDEDIV